MSLRRTLAVLPIFLAALLAQIYAPVGSGLAIGRSQKAEIAIAPPCSQHAHQAPASSGAPHSPGACCDLCEFVLSGAAAVAFAVPEVIFRPAPFHRIAWALPPGRIVAPLRGGSAQARAPPTAS
jgi:hypothetical protein